MMQDGAALSLLTVLLGPFVGSFIAVLVDRLPRGADVIAAPSACRSCGARLTLRDLVPVLSFALLRGRCRHCGAQLPGWLLYLELIAGGAGVIAVLSGEGPSAALLLWLLLALAAVDAAMFRLPDVLVALLLAVVLLRAPDLATALIGGAIGVAAFAAIRAVYGRVRGREGLGLGDVKLMAPLGAMAGPVLLPQLVLAAALLALAGALLLRRDGATLGAATPLPFGTALCAAAALMWAAYGL